MTVVVSLLGIVSGPCRSVPLTSILESPVLKLARRRLTRVEVRGGEKSFCRTLASFYQGSPALRARRLCRGIQPFFSRLGS